MKIVSLTEMAYMAGYIDGDGCFYIGKHQKKRGEKFRSEFIINTVDLENVKWMIKTFGGKFFLNNPFSKKHKPIHRYTNNEITQYPFENFLIQKNKEFLIFKEFRKSTIPKIRNELIEKMIITREINKITHCIKHEIETYKNTIEPIEQDFAYLAGFIDAECCLNIQKNFPKNRPNPTYKIQLQLNDTRSTNLKWIAQRFGGQFHFVKRHGRKNESQMCWRLSSKMLYPILLKIYPYLNHKKLVCKELINFYNLTLPNGGARHTEIFRSMYSKNLAQRESIFQNVQFLNKKGI